MVGWLVGWVHSQGETAFPERPADANTNQAGQTSTHHRGAHSHGCAEEDQREVRLETHSWEHRQQLGVCVSLSAENVQAGHCLGGICSELNLELCSCQFIII